MRARVPARLALVVLTALPLAGCHDEAHHLGPTAEAFLAEVENAQPSISSIRTPNQLVGLGHAVCADFSSGASYEETADRLSLDSGASSLPSEDLGAVIQAAADNLCPQYQGRV